MATLPPRQNPTPSKILRQHLSPLQTLLQMGFPKRRVEKALAATGFGGVQLASDWLLAHVNDPTLDLDSPREYVLYLCPTGPLAEQIGSFWDGALNQCGWNAAHNLVPHITLCSFFKCADDHCEAMVGTLRNLVHHFLSSDRFPFSIGLEKYASPNYMGLFLNNLQTDVIKKLAVQFCEEISPYVHASGESSHKELHLTLAYSFSPSHFSPLESLAGSVDPSSDVTWEIRLYSRDTRINGNEVHRVLYSHVPREVDELELLIGDFVYISGDSLTSSVDGWAEGTSWLTGSSGFLPKNYIERTSESDAWTLHLAIPIVGSGIGPERSERPYSKRAGISLSLLNLLENSEGSRRSDALSDSSSIERYHSRQGSLEYTHQSTNQTSKVPPNIDALYAKVEKQSKMKGREPLYRFPIEGPRRLFVSRHGERVDFTFGDWLRFCFNDKAIYKRVDLNMPAVLPRRCNAPRSFFKDCPLTNVGQLQAKLVGEAMHGEGIKIHHVFCSPSLRCIQTCTNILKGLGIADQLAINVEPGLFEWLAWYHEGMPTWMSYQELIVAGFHINPRYEPMIKPEDLKDRQESCEEFYERSYSVTQTLINKTQTDGGNILLVAHASSVDTCTRQLTGNAPRSAYSMTPLLKKIPYCSMSYCVQDPNSGSWSLCEPPFPPVSHSTNIRYDWKTLVQN